MRAPWWNLQSWFKACNCLTAFLWLNMFCTADVWRWQKNENRGVCRWGVWIFLMLKVKPCWSTLPWCACFCRVLNTSAVEIHDYVTTFPAYWFFNGLLFVLQILHLLWTYLILRIAFQKFQHGSVSTSFIYMLTTIYSCHHDIMHN